jgi:hypothetical protein
MEMSARLRPLDAKREFESRRDHLNALLLHEVAFPRDRALRRTYRLALFARRHRLEQGRGLFLNSMMMQARLSSSSTLRPSSIPSAVAGATC